MVFGFLRRRSGRDQPASGPEQRPAPETVEIGLAPEAIEAALVAICAQNDSSLIWTKETAKLVSRLSDEQRVVNVRLENFERRLTADLRGRMAQHAAPAPTEVDASAPLIEQRRFALREPAADLEIAGLMALSDWVTDDPPSVGFISVHTKEALRRLYPAGTPQRAVIACRSGLRLEVDLSDIFAASCAFGFLQESQDYALFMSLIRPGDIVVDVGANFGLYGVHAAHYTGAEGRVVAFEPAPETFNLLSANMARNGLADRAVCLQAGVGAAPGVATFNIAQDSAFSGLRDTGRSPTSATVEVEIVSLDTVPALAGATVDMIKIDVEGGEGAVLAGARDILARSPDPLAMMEFSHKNLDDAGRERVMAELAHLVDSGFEVMVRSEDGLAMVPLQLTDLEGQRSENLFLCRKGGAQMRRLQEACAAAPPRIMSSAEAAAVALLKMQVKRR